MKQVHLILLCLAIVFSKDHPVKEQIVIKGVFEYQHIGCCDPVASHIQFEHPMKDIPQVLLTIRAIEYESGPIAFFTSLNEITQKGFVAEVTIPKGILKLLIYEYVAINQEEVEMGFFNIDALGTLRLQQTGDATVPLFMRFKRHFVEEPLVQVFIVGFDTDTKEIQFEVSPFSVAQNGVTLKISKFGTSGLSRLQVSYVATEQSQELAKLITHTGVKTAAVQYEFVEIKEDDTPTSEEGETAAEAPPEVPPEPKLELMQLVGINGIRFQTTPISFIWQGDKMEPTALNVNLRITLDKGNQVILGLYYFELKHFRKCPIIFAECGYQGSHVYVCKNIPDFERVFKQAKSVKIPPKAALIVYQDTSYLGAKTKISQSQECLNDWFTDVPQEETKESQILLQLNRYKKHKGESDILMLQKSQKRNGEDYWQIQKKSFGVKMPEWYEYKQDGSIEKIGDDSGKKFEKIEIDDDKSNISFEAIHNHKKKQNEQIMEDDNEQDDDYNERMQVIDHLNDDDQVL